MGDIKAGTVRDEDLDQFDRFTVYFHHGVVDICREECGYLNNIKIPNDKFEKKCFTLGTEESNPLPFSEDKYIFGVENDDVTGSNKADYIKLGDGDDEAGGRKGKDIIDAGEGKDKLGGGMG